MRELATDQAILEEEREEGDEGTPPRPEGPAEGKEEA